MTEPRNPGPMSLERFAQLADAYGGIERWPADWRSAGWQSAQEPGFADVLARAQALDLQLDHWQVPLPSTALRQAVVASHRRQGLLRARQRAGLWWSALGLGTALAGAAAGSALAFTVQAFAVGATGPTPQFEATAFGDMGAGSGGGSGSGSGSGMVRGESGQ